MDKIKAVLFDLDGTLRHHIPSGGDFFVEQAEKFGLRISSEARTRAARWEHFYFASSLQVRSDMKLYAEDRKAFWTNYSRRLLVALGAHPGTAAELAPQIEEIMYTTHRPAVHVPPDAVAALETLGARGLTLGVVSNRETPYADELEKLGLAKHFKFSLAGGEVGSYKPEARIFARALELAGTAARETMYVGDNYFADVVGAKRAGLVPVLYDPAGLFEGPDCAVLASFHALPGLLE